MLKFKKRGLICDYNFLNLSWFKKNTMVPISYLVNDNILRIFIGMCDAENVGRIGYIDVNPENPKQILDYSKTPSLDIGQDGCFDDNGVLPSGILKENNKLYMFYSGYQKVGKVPYLIFAGIATSEDDGKSFTRLSKNPFLDRCNNELSIRAALNCRKNDNGYDILYLGGSDWVNKDGHLMPKYEIKYKFLQGQQIVSILNGFEDQVTAIKLKDDGDEFALAMPQVFIENEIFKMIYSIRYLSKGYRMGYAESFDRGKTWIRKDDQIDLDVSASGWDSEMICFGHLQVIKDKTYMFYCGNHYGMGGIGYAELIG